MEALSLAFLLAIGLVVLVLVRGNRRWWRQTILQEHGLLLGAAMASYGLAPHDAAAAGREAELQQAKRLCERCESIEQCVNHLAAHCREGLEAFCPNAALWTEMREWKRCQRPA